MGKSFSIAGEAVAVAPPEYVIVGKLQFFKEGGSPKHLLDIRAMLDVSPNEISLAELEKWIRERGLGKEWAQARASAP